MRNQFKTAVTLAIRQHQLPYSLGEAGRSWNLFTTFVNWKLNTSETSPGTIGLVKTICPRTWKLFTVELKFLLVLVQSQMSSMYVSQIEWAFYRLVCEKMIITDREPSQESIIRNTNSKQNNMDLQIDRGTIRCLEGVGILC